MKDIDRIDNILKKIESEKFNILFLPGYSEKKEILQMSKHHRKINNSNLDNNWVIDTLELWNDEKIKTYNIRPDKKYKLDFFIKIEIIKFLLCDYKTAKKIIDL